MIDESEREDFETAIREHGMNLDDFELTDNSVHIHRGAFYIPAGTVTIRRKSTRKEKTYEAGQMSKWPAEFHQDLEVGAFDC